MRAFIIEVICFALLQIALLAALFQFHYDIRHVSPLSPATIVKHERLKSAISPRMILIGGSNLLFGIDSTMIEQQTGYNPVNMGLIGGLRIDYITNEIREQLWPGDLVVMSLEYNTLNAERNTDESQVIMGVATQRPDNLRNLSWSQWKTLLDRGAVEYLGVVFRQAVSSISERERDDGEPIIVQDMNVYGDLTRYHDPAVKPRKQNNQNTLVKIKPEMVRANVARLNRFIAECRSRGVDVAFAYPPISRTHYQNGIQLARRFHRLLRDELDAIVICTPEDVVFDDRDFIGLSYHLRGTAVQQRTQRLIDAIHRRFAPREDSATPPISPASAPLDHGQLGEGVRPG
jgi:hypothetical protein